MTNREIDLIIGNDREWRKLLLKKFESIEDAHEVIQKNQIEMKVEMSTLKLKVAGISGLIGAAVTFIGTALFKN